ncbi:MAG: hypothetical protein SFU83_03020 [Meiothermus sp.]|nr:hypothetical protein [Meiothermus sp.]
MSKRANASPAEDSVLPPDSPDQNLEQIRLILFGQQMREFDRKLGGLEERFAQSASSMNQALLDRIGALENRLSGLLSQEADDRQIADRDLQNSLDSAVDALQTRLAAEIKDLRSDLREQGKETHKKMDNLGASLQAAVDELRLQKTDRVALANLLAGVADKLRKD